MNDAEEFYLSPEKKHDLEGELKERIDITRQEILGKLQYAKSLGDLSENAEYHDARERQGKNESRIKEIEHILKHAVLIQKTTDGTIGLGSVVTITKSEQEESINYTIVGPAEADMSSGRLSSASPLGESLMGAKAGDVIDFETPKGITQYKVISVE